MPPPPRPPVQATGETIESWPRWQKVFAKEYEQALQGGEILLSIDFHRKYRGTREQNFYDARSKNHVWADHLHWLEVEYGANELRKDELAKKNAQARKSWDATSAAEKKFRYQDRKPTDVFLEVLEETLSHQRAWEASKMSWKGFLGYYKNDTKFRKGYITLVGPLPKDATKVMFVAGWDPLVQEALAGSAPSAKAVLSVYHNVFRPVKAKKPEAEDASPESRRTPNQAAVAAQYAMMFSEEEEVAN